MLRAFVLLLCLLQGPSEARKQIQARYDAWSKAYMANDVETLLGMLAPEYTLTTVDGTLIKRSEYEAKLRLRKAANADTTKYATKILSLKMLGPMPGGRPEVGGRIDAGAEVIARESMTSMVDGKKVVHEHDYRDTWNHIGNSWLLAGTVTLKERTRSGRT